jgi:hypothetical protein
LQLNLLAELYPLADLVAERDVAGVASDFEMAGQSFGVLLEQPAKPANGVQGRWGSFSATSAVSASDSFERDPAKQLDRLAAASATASILN